MKKKRNAITVSLCANHPKTAEPPHRAQSTLTETKNKEDMLTVIYNCLVDLTHLAARYRTQLKLFITVKLIVLGSTMHNLSMKFILSVMLETR